MQWGGDTWTKERNTHVEGKAKLCGLKMFHRVSG